VGKTANILPHDLDVKNLLETFISNQQMILQGQQRLEQRLDAMEASLCATPKRKKKETQAYTVEDVIEILKVSRRTLYQLRKAGKIGFVKEGKTIWFSQHHIDNFLQIRDTKG